ncbi:MAG: beta-propeller domain-containing protein, partial [Actinobacteria bacterium]|nr:beta-propeller domain-containing protein [Actinomycetota bacterium]
MNRALTLATAGVLLLASCSDSSTPSTQSTDTTKTTDTTDTTIKPQPFPAAGFGSSRLAFFEDCPDLLGYLRTQALERVTAWGLDGGGGYYYRFEGVVTSEISPTAASDEKSSTDFGAAPSTEAPTYSGTNTQEVGVDEGDVVETNGTYIFVAGQDGVRIIEVATASVVTNLEVPDGTHQLLLDGTRLLVVTQPWSGAEDTVVSLYDVADAASPALLRRSHLEGRLVASRSIDGEARLVLTSTLANRLPFVFPDRFGLNEQLALDANKAVINESTIDEWLPRYFDESGDGVFGALSASLDCSKVAAPRDFAGLGISWIASIDLHGDTGPVGAAGIVSYGD